MRLYVNEANDTGIHPTNRRNRPRLTAAVRDSMVRRGRPFASTPTKYPAGRRRRHGIWRFHPVLEQDGVADAGHGPNRATRHPLHAVSRESALLAHAFVPDDGP